MLQASTGQKLLRAAADMRELGRRGIHCCLVTCDYPSGPLTFTVANPLATSFSRLAKLIAFSSPQAVCVSTLARLREANGGVHEVAIATDLALRRQAMVWMSNGCQAVCDGFVNVDGLTALCDEMHPVQPSYETTADPLGPRSFPVLGEGRDAAEPFRG